MIVEDSGKVKNKSKKKKKRILKKNEVVTSEDEQKKMQNQILTLDIDKDNVILERRALVHAAKYPSY